jgi:hypothetical protein
MSAVLHECERRGPNSDCSRDCTFVACCRGGESVDGAESLSCVALSTVDWSGHFGVSVCGSVWHGTGRRRCHVRADEDRHVKYVVCVFVVRSSYAVVRGAAGLHASVLAVFSDVYPELGHFSTSG